MTDQELITNNATREHILEVTKRLLAVARHLGRRAIRHDESKLASPELEIFAVYTEKLRDSKYGSEEYKGFLTEMKPALDNHYSKNRHHPEHHPNGIEDMTLIDLIEMLCDWKAASMRHTTGDILYSITINEERFDISPQLSRILRNTVFALMWDQH